MLGRDTTIILDGGSSTGIEGKDERDELTIDSKWQNYIVDYRRLRGKDARNYDRKKPYHLKPCDFELGL